MLANLQVPLGWKDLLRRSLKEAWADNILDLAAQQAYYFFFALFPALLFVVAVASFFPLQGLVDEVVQMIGADRAGRRREDPHRFDPKSLSERTAAAS